VGKVSLGLGLAVGYVLGAQAGRERYEQIKQAAAGFMGRPEVQQALERATTAAPEPLRPSLEKLTQAATGGQDAGAGSAHAGTRAADAGGSGAAGAPVPDPLIPPAKSV
jgi:hypothetical protein